MADHPFGPWRATRPAREAADVTVDERPLAGSWLDEFAVVYRACAHLGLTNPREVDELAIWEIAVILGGNDPEPEEDTETARTPVEGGPHPDNVRRMLAEHEAREQGREVTDADLRPRGEVVDLIRRGSKGGFG